MRQFILPEDYNGERNLILTGSPFHYICNVIRKKKGDVFPALDNQGRIWEASILEITEKSCSLSLSLRENSNNKKTTITLLQCLPKGKKIDLIIRQAVEAGVSKIIPVLSDYSIPRFDNENDIEKKLKRWVKIVPEAMQQSGSSILTRIEAPIKFDDIPRINSIEIKGLFFHQDKIDDNSLHKCLNENVEHVYIVIGPEGGLSSREINILIGAGYNAVHLGPNILRTETAALYATAAVKTLLLEKDKWNLNKQTAE